MKSLEKVRKKLSLKNGMTYRIDGNSFEQLMPADEFTYYLTGEYVGDPYDDVLLADGEMFMLLIVLKKPKLKMNFQNLSNLPKTIYFLTN